MTDFLNYKIIEEIIPKEASVLDLGCGSGELMNLLKIKGCSVDGIEIDQDRVVGGIAKGLSVIQGDLDEGLADYEDKSYDYVILHQTLQSLKTPYFVVSEILRVGKKAIVSFPNFGYYKVRFGLMFTGKMPKSNALPYEWYNTPNIHLLTMNDFYDFSNLLNFKIEQKICLNQGKVRKGLFDNFLTEEALFVISKSA